MNCRICATPTVTPFLSLGKLPLGNAFLKAGEKGESYDLTLGFCPTCTLVQSMNPPPPDVLQRDYRDYKYVPVGDSLRGNLTALGKELGEAQMEKDFRQHPSTRVAWDYIAREAAKSIPSPFVVDIGSNDGTLLKGAKSVGARVMGIEPAEAISEQARKDGIPTHTGFFDMRVAEFFAKDYPLADGPGTANNKADVVVTTQTLQHVPDPVAFCQAVKHLLKPGGRFVIEGRYFVDTVEKGLWDTIYHEMMSCFTLNSLRELLAKIGFGIEAVKHVDTYGGSLRVYAREGLDSEQLIPTSIEEEGQINLAYYQKFASDVVRSREKIHDLILLLHAKGAKIVGYGAPSTSTTLLGYTGLGHCIDYIVDDNPLKQGLLHPVGGIPVVGSHTLNAKRPDYIWIFAPQFADVIMQKTSHLECKYITAFPEPMVAELLREGKL